MPYRRIFFEKYQPFHILSRAVEEREIFEKEESCYRFIFQIYAANLGKPAPNIRRRDVIKIAKALLHGEEIPEKFIFKEHPPLIHLIDFSQVINHYHFYLVPNIENGVPIFMKKLNGGFAKYFNLKYGRKGALFGSRYKAVLIQDQFQSDAVSRYVSIINPLDVYQPGWREKGLENWEKAFDFLKNYQFSSFPDKIGERSSKILAPKEILTTYFFRNEGEESGYLNFVKDFLKTRLSLPPYLIE